MGERRGARRGYRTERDVGGGWEGEMTEGQKMEERGLRFEGEGEERGEGGGGRERREGRDGGGSRDVRREGRGEGGVWARGGSG